MPVLMPALVLLMTGCADDATSVDSGATDSGPIGTTTDTQDTQPPSDVDQDGFTIDDGDCDDADPAVHPGAPEVCNDRDDDCNDLVDDAPTDGTTTYADLDGDGYGDPDGGVLACGAEDRVADATDCDDSQGTVHPGATEVCGNGWDDDCDQTANDCRLTGRLDL